jgi:hypothetical protein
LTSRRDHDPFRLAGGGAAHCLCATAKISLSVVKPGINIINEFLLNQTGYSLPLYYLSRLPFQPYPARITFCTKVGLAATREHIIGEFATNPSYKRQKVFNCLCRCT